MMKRSVAGYSFIITFLCCLIVAPTIYAQSYKPVWQIPDSSIRMARQTPGENTRSSQPQLSVPMKAIDTNQSINWSELLAMLGVFSGVVGGIQWVVVRVLIEPMIRNQSEIMKKWAEETFPTAKEFSAHTKTDDIQQQRLEKEIDQIWSRLNHTN